jgi:hypothetical protein
MANNKFPLSCAFGHGTVVPLGQVIVKDDSLNFSQFVEGRRWWPWAREGIKETHVFAGDEPCIGEEIHRVSSRFDALQTARN